MELVKLATKYLHNLETGQFIVRYFSDFESIGTSPSFDPEFQAIHQDLQLVFTMSKRRSTNNQNYITKLGAINNGRTYYANIIANRGNI